VGVAQELQAHRRPRSGRGPSGRNVEVDCRGQSRGNQTHRSTTDPEALLARKSNNTATRLCYAGHLLMENRNALIVDAELTEMCVPVASILKDHGRCSGWVSLNRSPALLLGLNFDSKLRLCCSQCS
jgi:hypothetical protein